MQNFSRFYKSHKELRELLQKGSKSQSKGFFLVTLLEFFLVMNVIIIGAQITKITGLDLNEIDSVITIVALLFTIYFFGDFIIKFHKIRTTFPSSSFLVHFKKTRESFKNFFLLFLSTYGIYLIIILNSIYQKQNNNTNYLLENLESLPDVYKVYLAILVISIYCIGFLTSIWFLEGYFHKKLMNKIEGNLRHFKLDV